MFPSENITGKNKYNNKPHPMYILQSVFRQLKRPFYFWSNEKFVTVRNKKIFYKVCILFTKGFFYNYVSKYKWFNSL